ncbi:ROK family protein [Jeotgalibaca sp. MA1X17-3]|uniref:ROK family transcriptional regulator n=1 Tax=Jeotgalibaca sp. MA1X17-3 TaxID=2908211 RepID=UPI001F2247A7|nr:ROK family transcriptional regulator [Jeotgalibaca sp. MA1X17-3]UJF15544.1 ROK family protein [Jeotgalibaca sp. MA1X17-3]
MVTDKFSIRKQNELLILSTIIHSPCISRADISQITGLNKASTSNIVKKLIEEELILEIGAGSSTSSGGRKPILLELNAQAGCSLSIDLGSDYITSILTDLNGTILVETKESRMILHKENVVSKIEQIVKKLEKQYINRTFQLVGITLAIHGIVNQNQIVFTPYYDLDEIDLVQLLEERISVPIQIENEANLSAWGEAAFSEFRKNIISVSIHSGIGAGIVINGELYHGYAGQGGEIGHMIIYPEGKPCPCGNRGCMEQYASEKAILEEYRNLSNHATASLKDLAKGYRMNHQIERDVVHQAVTYIAIGMNNLIAHFDPEIILLNSNLFREMPFLLELVRKKMVSTFSRNALLAVSEIGEQATLLGGTVVNLRKFFHLPFLSFLKNT